MVMVNGRTQLGLVVVNGRTQLRLNVVTITQLTTLFLVVTCSVVA